MLPWRNGQSQAGDLGCRPEIDDIKTNKPTSTVDQMRNGMTSRKGRLSTKPAPMAKQLQ